MEETNRTEIRPPVRERFTFTEINEIKHPIGTNAQLVLIGSRVFVADKEGHLLSVVQPETGRQFGESDQERYFRDEFMAMRDDEE